MAGTPTTLEDGIVVKGGDLIRIRTGGAFEIDTIRVNMFAGRMFWIDSGGDVTVTDLTDLSGNGFSVRAIGASASIRMKWRLGLTIQDTSQTAISGATVTITDSDGSEVSGSPFTTDANGEITEQALTYRHYFTDADSNVTNKVYDPYTVQISASGYITQTHKITMDEKKDLVFTLEASNKWIAPQGDTVYQNLDQTNAHNKFNWEEV